MFLQFVTGSPKLPVGGRFMRKVEKNVCCNRLFHHCILLYIYLLITIDNFIGPVAHGTSKLIYTSHELVTIICIKYWWSTRQVNGRFINGGHTHLETSPAVYSPSMKMNVPQVKYNVITSVKGYTTKSELAVNIYNRYNQVMLSVNLRSVLKVTWASPIMQGAIVCLHFKVMVCLWYFDIKLITLCELLPMPTDFQMPTYTKPCRLLYLLLIVLNKNKP